MPQWAQRHIERLATEVARFKRQSEERYAGLYPTNVEILTGGIEQGPLPKNAIIRFLREVGGERDYFDVRLDKDGRLDICASDFIAVAPDASNHVHIFLPRAEAMRKKP